jgi:uncharacterized phage protein (TIGR01671 family)
MTRDIVFRGKRIDNKEWAEGALFDGEHYCVIGQNIKFSPYIENECKIVGFRVDRDSVGQFTGFTDMNGERIFEGDILSYQVDELYPENVISATVAFDNGKFVIIDAEGLSDELDEFVCQMSTVAGNEFDELQEGG